MPTHSCHEFGYTANDRWAKLPPNFSRRMGGTLCSPPSPPREGGAGIASDAPGPGFAVSRGGHPLLIFDRDGTFVEEWDGSMFVRPHGITIGPDDSVYCTDDTGHTVRKFSPDGKLEFTLGTHGKPSDTGATSIDFRTIKRAG